MSLQSIGNKMTTKQVKLAAVSAAAVVAAAAEGASISTLPTTNEAVKAPETNAGPSNLFISVKTFDAEGKTLGERVVDMYHFGTRNWLQNHHWWAMHNGHCVETNVATGDEITTYLSQSKLALAAKFNAKAA